MIDFKTRCNDLINIGLKFDFDKHGDGGNYIYPYRGINVHWTDIQFLSDDEWHKLLAKLKTIIEDHKINNRAIDESLSIEYPDTFQNY